MPRKGQYAEIMAEYAEHIFRENLSCTKRGVSIPLPGDIIREIDVIATLHDGKQIAMEVRDRKSVQNIDWIDQVVGKYNGTHFSEIWVCTFDGCTLSSGAIKKLEQHGVRWRDFTLIDFDSEKSGVPVLFLEGISLNSSEEKLTVNGQIQTDLKFICENDFGDLAEVSFREMIQDIFRQQISDSYESFVDQNFWTAKQRVENVDNNFNIDILNIEYQAPIKHHVFVDYFNEAFCIKDDGVNLADVLSTQDKSLFCVGDTIKINWSFFNRLEEKGIVLKPSVRINVKAIPESYRDILMIDPIDIDGTGKKLITKVIGF